MLVPLAVLAIGAAFAGMIFDSSFIGPDSRGFWHGTLGAIAGRGLNPQVEDFPMWVELAPFVLTLLGFAVA